jgi:hypothetical protein
VYPFLALPGAVGGNIVGKCVDGLLLRDFRNFLACEKRNKRASDGV